MTGVGAMGAAAPMTVVEREEAAVALTVKHGAAIREAFAFPGDPSPWRPMLTGWELGAKDELRIFYDWKGKKLDDAGVQEFLKSIGLGNFKAKALISKNSISTKFGWKPGLPNEPFLPPDMELKVRQLQGQGQSRLSAILEAGHDEDFVRNRVRWELASWAPENISDDLVGIAAATRRPWLLELLLKHGADPNSAGATMDLFRLERRPAGSHINTEDIMAYAVANLLVPNAGGGGRRYVHPVVAALNPEASGPFTATELGMVRQLAKAGARLSPEDLELAKATIALRGGNAALSAEVQALALPPKVPEPAVAPEPPGAIATFFREAWEVLMGRKFLP
ncbi:MAG: hypothetical protein U1E65_06835 [Myxococcota bacterium]